jgi:hypothetical protein
MTTETAPTPPPVAATPPHSLTVNGCVIPLPRFQPRVRQLNQPAEQRWIEGAATEPDVWLHVVPVGTDQWVCEGEVSNASFAPGLPARATVRCKVQAQVSAGCELTHDLRDLPSSLLPKRAAIFRLLIHGGDASPIDVNLLDQPLPKWEQVWGPLGMRMPIDDFPDHGPELEVAFETGATCTNEDQEDAVHGHEYGPPDTGAVAGSKIRFGHSYQNLLAVKVLARAAANRAFHAFDRRTGEPITVEYYGAVTPVVDELSNELPEYVPVVAGLTYERKPFNPEHRVRQALHDQTWWSMTRSALARRRIICQGEMDRLLISERGPTNFTPDWRPRNVHQLLEMALQNPHQGLPGEAGRGMGWLGWNYAWRILVDPHGPWSRAFVTTYLACFETGASLSHGFVQRDSRVMPDGHTEENVAQTFEVTMLSHAVLGLARLSGAGMPHWPMRVADTIYRQQALAYSGYPSPPHVLQWRDDGTMQPAPGTDADPAFGFFDELCAALYRTTGRSDYLQMSCKFHQPAPDWNTKWLLMQEFPDDQDKRECVELRGIGLLRPAGAQ